MFQTYNASASSKCCKSRSRCCICCKAKHACFKYFICFRHMLQAFSSGCFKSRSWEEHMLQLRGAAAAACGSTYVSKVYCCCVGHRAVWCCVRMHDYAACWCHVGVGHCIFQKYAAIAVVWVTMPHVGAACMPPTADIVVCACGCVKVEQARVVLPAWASESFFP